MRTIPRSIQAAAIGWSIAGCEIIVIEAPGPSDAGLEAVEVSGDDAMSCPSWEARPASEVEQLVRQTIAEMQAQGEDVTATLWEDSERFSEVIRRVYERASCPLPPRPVGQALTAEDGQRMYCGPGQGAPSLLAQRPIVDECLNNACRAHDACYAMCDRPLPKTCQWSVTTTDCDDPFIAASKSCPLTEHRFWSLVVIIVADFLNRQANFDCVEVECPTFGGMGKGPCSGEISVAKCERCLDHVDSDRCGDALCGDEPERALCLAATCSNTAQCLGGYGYGEVPEEVIDAGPSDASGPTLPAPEDVWLLRIVDGQMPATKPSGEPWDVGTVEDTAPPDARVIATLDEGTAVHTTSLVQDDQLPAWGEDILSAPAAQLASLFVEVRDVDVIFDDPIGQCYPPSAFLAKFGRGAIDLDCSPGELAIRVELLQTQ
jgi:hypothetical protein